MEDFLNPRKRRRVVDQSCDLTSLAKRFRDLSLNVDYDSSIYSVPTINSSADRKRIDAAIAAAIETECPAAADDDGYHPELGIEENPFYYEKNKLLHDLHAERVRRKILADQIKLQVLN